MTSYASRPLKQYIKNQDIKLWVISKTTVQVSSQTSTTGTSSLIYYFFDLISDINNNIGSINLQVLLIDRKIFIVLCISISTIITVYPYLQQQIKSSNISSLYQQITIEQLSPYCFSLDQQIQALACPFLPLLGAIAGPVWVSTI